MKKLWLVVGIAIIIAALPALAAAQGADYTVRSGDTLSSLAAEHLGDPGAYLEIVEATNSANAEDGSYAFIEDPNLIRTGWKLRMPAAVGVVETSPAEEPTMEQATEAAPSGSGRIAFATFDQMEDMYKLYLVNPDGTGLTRLQDHASEPELSPAGDRVAFRSWAEGDRALVVETFDGSARYRIGSYSEDSHPSWAANGELIAFDSRREEDRLWRVHTVTVDGEEESIVKVQAQELLGERPALSPDASRIVCRSFEGASAGLFVVNRGGGGKAPLTAGASDTAPAWSPDGSKVAFMSAEDGNWEIYVVEADGSGRTRLTGQPGNDGLPAWSPDGSKIAFVTDRGGVWSIYAMNADGSGQAKVIEVGGGYDNNRYGEDRTWADEQLSWGP